MSWCHETDDNICDIICCIAYSCNIYCIPRSRAYEPAGWCVHQRAPSTESHPTEDRGTSNTRRPSLRHQQTTACLPWLRQQDSTGRICKIYLQRCDCAASMSRWATHDSTKMFAILQATFLNQFPVVTWISIHISLKFISWGPANDEPDYQIWVERMAWCRTGDNQVSEPMMGLYTKASNSTKPITGNRFSWLTPSQTILPISCQTVIAMLWSTMTLVVWNKLFLLPSSKRVNLNNLCRMNLDTMASNRMQKSW